MTSRSITNGIKQLIQGSITVVFLLTLLLFFLLVPLAGGAVVMDAESEERIYVELEGVSTGDGSVETDSVHDYNSLSEDEKTIIERANDGERVSVSTEDTPDLFTNSGNVAVVSDNGVYVYTVTYQVNERLHELTNAIAAVITSFIIGGLVLSAGVIVHEEMHIMHDRLYESTIGIVIDKLI